MRILLVNKFLYPKGGDAISMLNTGRLLAAHGHEVHYWGMSHPANPEYPEQELFVSQVDYHQKTSPWQAARRAQELLYSFEAKKKAGMMIKRIKPDLVHVHNFAHQLSPSILHVFRKQRIPVVMTLHDYILVCPVYTLLSQGWPCRQCRQGHYFRCFLQRCTQNSYAKSLLSSLEMVLHHQLLKIYDFIDVFLAPSRFMQQTVGEMGFCGDVRYLPNFVKLDHFTPHSETNERSVVYFGRLSEEKGLKTLIDAASGLDVTVKLIGEGSQRGELEQTVRVKKLNNIRFLGYLQGENLQREIRNSLAVIQPSVWYENNPLSVLEAFALGKPVIGSDLGGIPELVRTGETGLIFPAGDAAALRDRISQLLQAPEQAAAMGRTARIWVEQELNAERHYRELFNVYQQAAAKYPH